MGNVAHLDKKDKQKAAVTASDPAQLRVMRTARDQQRLKSVKIPHVPMLYPAKSGNVEALSRLRSKL
tara:strand:+ start:62 stop:262 length:201 start_codon:yes stop_codon:yes gene_type:complete